MLGIHILTLKWPCTLQNVFSLAGEVQEVRLKLDKETQQCKGFGFVKFNTDAEATNAVTELNKVEVCGREVRAVQGTYFGWIRKSGP